MPATEKQMTTTRDGGSAENAGAIFCQDNLSTLARTVQKRNATGRGSSKKIDLYGIKKLRELILEQAVRGKLVPQNTDDEPASVLLERIAEERGRLVKEKKIKKPKKLPEIGEDEKPFELPARWEWARLGDIVEILDGQRKPISKNSRTEGPYPYYGASGIVDYVSGYIFDEPLVLIGEDGAKWGRGDRTAFSISGKTWVNNHAHVVRPNRKILIDYYLIYAIAQQDLQKYITGITVPKLNQAKLASIVLPIPNPDEQHRIVAKVDELMTLCDQIEQQTEASLSAHGVLVENLLSTLTNSANAEELEQNWQRIAEHFTTLFTTEESIDQLKQTILQLAVMGKLVPQDSNDEPAAKLLEQIAAEKAQLIKEKKIKKQKALPPITEEEKPFELPEGWEWCRIWDIAKLITSGSRDWAKYYSNDGAIFVTMGNLSRGNYHLRMDSIRYVSPPQDSEGARTKLKAGDLLISITGDVGNLGLIPEGFGEAYINQHTCLLRFMPDCQNLFFPEMMRSPLARNQYDAPQRGIKNSFRLGDVGEMLCPIPPLAEQYRILSKVDELMLLCDQIKTRLQQQQQTRIHLTDAMVESALA